MHTHTPSRFGSAELKMTPSAAVDMEACLGVGEVGSGSDIASIKTTAVTRKGKLNIHYDMSWDCISWSSVAQYCSPHI